MTQLGSNKPLGLWRQDWLLTLLLVIVTNVGLPAGLERNTDLG
jgi:hypothetical protein